MNNITIQDLPKVNLITEVENSELDTVNGGLVPVAVGIAAGASFISGVGIGVSLYNVTQND